jgi:hypothetical protein
MFTIRCAVALLISFPLICLSVFLPFAALGDGPVAPYINDWTTQFGTADWDQANGVSADGAGNVYVTGETTGSLGGANAGMYDSFTNSYDIHGAANGSTQTGTTGSDIGTGVAADGLGNVFVSGYSQGPIDGPNGGGYQATLNNYSPSGTLQWSHSIGPVQTYGYSVAADGQGNAYIAGYTTGSLNEPNSGGYDGFIAKYDAVGNAQWTHQFGTTAQDQAYGVSSDGSNGVYVVGSTTGDLGATNAGGFDAFVRKYDAAGNVQWTQQFGTAGNDIAQAVSANKAGSVFVVGNTSGALGGANAGLSDAFVSKFNAAGTLQWIKQFGTASNDYAYGAAADAHGNVFVVGYTQGSLGGTNAGNYDAFLTEFNGAGQQMWTEQFGTPGIDLASSVTVDAQGHVYVVGSTTGALGGPNAGSFDGWIARFSPVPVPGDFNRDGVVDSADIVAMVGALVDLPGYMSTFDVSATDLMTIGNLDGDNAITNADLQALLNMLISGGTPVQNVPEPAGFVLMVISGMLGAVSLRKKFKTK